MQMFELYHRVYHVVDDHNQLRQGEVAFADVWLTQDWAERHFAEGLGLWEVNVFKASAYFQKKTWNHNEFRKQLAHAFLTLGKHTYGEPLVPAAVDPPPAEPSPLQGEHPLKFFSEMPGGTRDEKHVCGYCGIPGAYMCCIGCFPTIDQAKFGICNPSTGRDCYEQHLAGKKNKHKMRKVKQPSRSAEATTAEEQAEQEAARERKLAGSRAGGKASGESRKRARSPQ